MGKNKEPDCAWGFGENIKLNSSREGPCGPIQLFIIFFSNPQPASRKIESDEREGREKRSHGKLEEERYASSLQGKKEKKKLKTERQKEGLSDSISLLYNLIKTVPIIN